MKKPKGFVPFGKAKGDGDADDKGKGGKAPPAKKDAAKGGKRGSSNTVKGMPFGASKRK